MKYMVSAWKESKELDVRAIAFQLISIFNWNKGPRAEGFRNKIALRLAAGALVFAALSQAGVEQASAQQTPAVSQQFSGSGPGTENNDEQPGRSGA